MIKKMLVLIIIDKILRPEKACLLLWIRACKTMAVIAKTIACTCALTRSLPNSSIRLFWMAYKHQSLTYLVQWAHLYATPWQSLSMRSSRSTYFYKRTKVSMLSRTPSQSTHSRSWSTTSSQESPTVKKPWARDPTKTEWKQQLRAKNSLHDQSFQRLNLRYQTEITFADFYSLTLPKQAHNRSLLWRQSVGRARLAINCF